MEARAIATATYEMNAALQKSCLTTYCALNIRCSRYRSCFHQLRITLNNKFKWDSPGTRAFPGEMGCLPKPFLSLSPSCQSCYGEVRQEALESFPFNLSERKKRNGKCPGNYD